MKVTQVGPTVNRGEKRVSPYKGSSLLQKIEKVKSRDQILILSSQNSGIPQTSGRTSPSRNDASLKKPLPNVTRFSLADLTGKPTPIFHDYDAPFINEQLEDFKEVEVEQIDDLNHMPD